MFNKSYIWMEKYIIGFLRWLLLDYKFLIGAVYGIFVTVMFIGEF